MQINKNYRLGTYNLGYQLEKKRKHKVTGEEYYTAVSFWGFNLEQALLAINERMVCEGIGENTDLLNIYNAIHKSRQAIIEAVKEMEK